MDASRIVLRISPINKEGKIPSNTPPHVPKPTADLFIHNLLLVRYRLVIHCYLANS